ncbi:MAG TPA: hypothetical protein VGN16_14870 [Acidobacteriaceae bacterium]
MRIYTESSEEALLARKLLKQWADDGALSKEQYEHLEQDTVSGLRTTNVFLRLVLFFFTVIVVAAGVGLFFLVFLSHPSEQTGGITCLIFAAICYAVAEAAVARAYLYRFGIEEALGVCSVALFCGGLASLFAGGNNVSPYIAEFLVPAAGCVLSLWGWYRFGFWYAFPAAMIFALFLPIYWNPSLSEHHVFVAVLYAAGWICIAKVRSPHRLDYLNKTYSIAEACLWLGIYLILNLKISASLAPGQWLFHSARATSEFAAPFYWTTWVLIWCLPPLVLARGIRQKDRFVIAVGAILALLTLVTNKPYLGWQRHTWDPMLLGIALAGVAVFLQRWLAQGPDGVRHGFTAARLSAKDKHALNTGAAVLGLLSPQVITPSPQATGPDFDSGFGGASGGGGASGDF